MRPTNPPRSPESLAKAGAGVNALPALAATQAAASTLSLLALLWLAPDDGDEIVAVWALLWLALGAPQTACLAWLGARLDRRLQVRPPAARALWWPAAAAVTTAAWWLPVLLLSPLSVVLGLAEGRRAYAAGVVYGLAAWLIVPVSAWVARWLWKALARRPVQRRPKTVHLTDTLPTSAVAGLWAASLCLMPVGWLAYATAEAGVVAGALACLAWLSLPAVGGAAAARWLPVPPQGRQEVTGALGVATGGVLFVICLMPEWHGHDDARWALFAVAFVAVLAGVGLWVDGRAERRGALLPRAVSRA
jgi:hypothetical protein